MFTIIIPTYNHEDTIKLAISSALNQTYQDFEIFVVGDGASQHTKEIVSTLSKKDSRIRYFENTKGEGNGELHRHNAILEAKGKYIAYLGDDDIWLPNHLATLLPYLNEFDFVHSAQATILEKNNWHVYAEDVNHPLIRKRMLNERYNFFGPTTVAHRIKAYHTLPYGWRAKPKKMLSDLHMWRQWILDKNSRLKSIPIVTILHLNSPTRLNMTTEERCNEMQFWLNKINNTPDEFHQYTQEKLLQSWQQQIITYKVSQQTILGHIKQIALLIIKKLG